MCDSYICPQTFDVGTTFTNNSTSILNITNSAEQYSDIELLQSDRLRQWASSKQSHSLEGWTENKIPFSNDTVKPLILVTLNFGVESI